MSNKKASPPSTQIPIFDMDPLNPDSETSIHRKTNSLSNVPKITKPVSQKPGKSPGHRQPALPGIAVRGRPRLRVKPTASERAARSRRNREAAGAKRIELVLDPRTVAGLEALVRVTGETRGQVIARLIQASLRRRRIAVPPTK